MADPLKLFVGGLPYNVTEDMIMPLFSQCGQVLELSIMKDRTSGQSKGCAWLKYRTSTECEAAMQLCDQKPISDLLPEAFPAHEQGEKVRPVEVRYAPGEQIRAENKVFVGGLPLSCGEESVKATFSQYGELKEVHMIRKDGQSKGAAFVKFIDPSAALAAIDASKIPGGLLFDGASVPSLRVAYANTTEQRDQHKQGGMGGMGGNGGPGMMMQGGMGGMGPMAGLLQGGVVIPQPPAPSTPGRIFLSQLPVTRGEKDILGLASCAGNVLEFSVVRNVRLEPTGQAWVQYYTQDEAVKAIAALQNYRFMESQCPIVVSMSAPPPPMELMQMQQQHGYAPQGMHQQMMGHHQQQQQQQQGPVGAMPRGSGIGGMGAGRGPAGANLFVDGLPPNDDHSAVEAMVMQKFQPFGPIKSMHVNGQRGFAIVSFEEAASASAAIQNLSGTTWMPYANSPMRVTVKEEKPSAGPYGQR